MSILPLSEAEQEPVGEGWDEPNINPKLMKPTEGRGFGDRLAALGIKVSLPSLPGMDIFRKLMIAGALVTVGFLVIIVGMNFIKPKP